MLGGLKRVIGVFRRVITVSKTTFARVDGMLERDTGVLKLDKRWWGPKDKSKASWWGSL